MNTQMIKIINWFKKRSLFIAIKDIQTYRSWIKTIKKEKANKQSTYNRFGLKHNYFYNLYLVASLDEKDKDAPENAKRLIISKELAPIHRYLDEELMFADYIVPEFFQFYSEENNDPTLSYFIVYRFAFKKLSIWFITKILVLLGIILYGYFHYETFINWVSKWF